MNGLPDFLVIGAGKSGTTSLHEYLNQHPQIFMGTKEPNFFHYELETEDSFDIEATKKHYRESVTDLTSYKGLFKDAKDGQLLGEVSNLYLNSEKAYKRIEYYVPEVKLIAILRHPADRLFSRYYHLVREDKLPSKSFDDIFDKSSIWWRRADLIPEGFYFSQLKKFYDTFKRDQIKVFLYEEFINETDRVVKDIFEFLNVNPDIKVGTDVIYNKSGEVKNKAIDTLVGQNSAPILFLKRYAPAVHKAMKNSVQVNRILNALRNKNLEKPELSKENRKRIIEEIYKEDILELQQLLQRDLSHWL